MRDQKRRERALMEEAYQKVQNEMNTGPASQTASIGAQGPLFVSDEESCGEYDQSEIDMAGRELLKAQEYAAKLSEIVPTLPGLDGWVASKITKAADYLSSVFHYLDYEINETEEVVIDVQEIEIPVDQFNIGYEEVGNT
tara:strand:- start:710 stop:1129 length:420 start_codon:yes stop_codon:yes gene_type:complete